MKTTDSVMREKYREIGAEVIRIAHKFGINEIDLAGELGTLSQLNKDLASHSLAEARREWVEEIEKMKCKVPKKPPLDADDDDSLNKAFKYVGRYNYNKAIKDVLDLLTGDNPERKV